jgi:chromosome segregation ATPase
LIRKQNDQLAQLKEQYVRLREQFKEEQRESSAKLLDLQREIRAEQKRVEELEDEIRSISTTGESSGGRCSGSMEAVEQIWQLMQEYHDSVHPGVGRAGKQEKSEFKRTVSPRMGGTSPRVGRRFDDGQRQMCAF